MTGCDEAQALAAEFSLGLLAGDARARVVDHLAGCASCRGLVRADGATVEALLLTGPEIEPPAGFEARVLTAIDGQPVPLVRRPRRRLLALVAAAVVLLAAVGVGFAVRARSGGSGDDRAASVRAAAMVGPGGYRVGRAILADDPPTVAVVVPGWQPDAGADAGYELQIGLEGGEVGTVADVHLVDGRWISELPSDPEAVRWVALVDPAGDELCRARFTTT